MMKTRKKHSLAGLYQKLGVVVLLAVLLVVAAVLCPDRKSVV